MGMKFLTRNVALLAMAACLGGCGNLGKTMEERITDAMPPGSEVLAGKAGLDATAKIFAADVAALESEYQSRLIRRARECSGSYVPSFLSSAQDIRSALSDKACFVRADASLSQWLGMRRASLLIAAPPLRAVPKSPLQVLTAPSYIADAAFATRAGVALLQLADKYLVVDIGSGQVLAERNGLFTSATLSPNGRVVISSNSEGRVQLSDTESGDALATFSMTPSGIHLVGDVGVIYTPRNNSDQKMGNAGPVFLDLASGNMQSLLLSSPGLQMVYPVPGKPLHFLLMAWKTIAEIELHRDAEGWTTRILSEREMPISGWGRSNLSSDETFAFSVAGGIKRIALPSLQASSITLSPLMATSATTTPDPDALVITGYFTNDPEGSRTYIYSISKRTLAVLDDVPGVGSRVLYVPSLRRNAVVNNAQIRLVERFQSQPPVDVNTYLEVRTQAIAQLVAARNAQLNQSLLRAAEVERHAAGRIPMTTEQLRLLRAALLRSTATNSARATAPRLPHGEMAELGRTSHIEAVGVYEGRRETSTSGAGARIGTVQVRVRRSNKPIILVLSSYESVRWIVTLEPGAKLAAVLTSGYSQSQVYGAGAARIHQVGNAYSYQRGGDGYTALDAEVVAMTGKSIEKFQGRYTGEMFMIGM
jgi:hypothetical protein